VTLVSGSHITGDDLFDGSRGRCVERRVGALRARRGGEADQQAEDDKQRCDQGE